VAKRRSACSSMPSVTGKVSKAKSRKRLAATLEAAVARHQAGDLPAAEAGYREILGISASEPRALHLLGTLHAQTGRLASAVELLRQALRLDPRNAETHNNLGLALHGVGEIAGAAAAFREAVRLNPRYPEALNNLGDLLREEGKVEAAVERLEAALRLRPHYPEALNNLGVACLQAGRHERAMAAFTALLSHRPSDYATHRNLAVACQAAGELDTARSHYDAALAIDGRDPEVHLKRGATALALGDPDDALRCYQGAVRADAHHAGAYNNIAAILRDRGDLAGALDHLGRATALDPDLAEAHANLGRTLLAQGRHEEAEAAYLRASELDPANAALHSNYLAALPYGGAHDPAEILSLHRQWAARHARVPPLLHAPAGGDPERRLRIGYVSPDFRRHAVATFLEPIVAAHDRSRVEVFCYSNVQVPDPVTTRFADLADGWREISHLDDDAAAALIREDGIDLLVDLTGHVARNRLKVFARRPAPVQVTYLGYYTTTGMDTIDYRLTDAWVDPPGAEAHYTEVPYRLPNGWLCFQPPDDAPPVNEPPCHTAGHVTFGSFNNLAKITPEVIRRWSEVLTSIPGSRMVMKDMALRDAATCAGVRDAFAAHGVATERLDLVGWTKTRADHLALYGHIDLCLDTFPYNGGTTTCEALWMGVPVVTVAGDRYVSRFGVSILSQVGLGNLVAPDVEEFLTIATALAGNVDEMAELRRQCRPSMASSTLCQPEAFARQLEEAYHHMYWSVAACAGSRE